MPDFSSVQEVVTGSVMDSQTGESLPGVNIVVKGTTSGTTTDFDGFYEATVPSLNDTLVFSYVGYQQQEIPIDGRTEIDVELQTASLMGDELVVTGYSTETRSSLTGSVSVVDMNDLNSISSEQVTKQLQGQIAGVTVLTSGEVGEEATIRIRGLNTFGNNSPLYIVDGVPTQNIGDLNSNDIESMQVLKDASAASIYGARASNGVVVITTQQGQTGDVSITYSGRYSYSVPEQGNVFGMANPQEFAQIVCESRLNDGNTSPHPQYGDCNNPTLPDYIAPAGAFEGDPGVNPDLYNVQPEYADPQALGSFYPIIRANKEGTNWMDEIFNPAGTMNHNISVSGGGDIGNYLLSVNYTDAWGTHNAMTSNALHSDQRVGNHMDRYILRANTTFRISDNLRVGENLSYSVQNLSSGGPSSDTRERVRETPAIIP
ncbi:MAG: carboxypeptidase-like regulatory domain-containing protein, partial [Balneolaceae bacterium]